MEYDPAFPTEDNDEEIDHIIDVTDIPLPVTKKKNKRTKLMKIPLPDDKSDVIKPLVETSNSPPQEPDTSWLQPTSTQGPLKFNIMKSNTMKPTDEENNVFDDLELKVEPTKLPKLFPKKSKPMTLPTGVIVKNADFVVNEPKTNTELFLPPKITSIESNTLSNANIDMANMSYGNSVTNPNMIAALNNQNLINSYPLMNMSYIIPQKLRSAQMISQPLVANPAIASLSQKKAQETNNKNESRKRSRSSSRGRSISPKARIGRQSKSKSPKPRLGRQSKSKSPKIRIGRESKSKSPKPRHGRQSKSKSPKSRIGRQSKSKSPKSRIGRISKSKSPKPKIGRQSKSKSPKSEKSVIIESIADDSKPENSKESSKKEDSPFKSSSPTKQNSPSRSVSQNRARRSNSRDLKPARARRSNSPRPNQRGAANSPANRYQSKQRQRSSSRSKARQRRSPVNPATRRRRSHSRNRRSHSPHRGMPNRTRRSPSPNNRWRRSPRSRSGNRPGASSFNNRHDYGYQDNSATRSWNRNHRSGSRDKREAAWQSDSGDEVVITKKPTKDCWAVESESGSHSTPLNSEVCDKVDILTVKLDKYKEVDKVDIDKNDIHDKNDNKANKDVDKVDVDEANETDDDVDDDQEDDDTDKGLDKADSKKPVEIRIDLVESPEPEVTPEEKIIVSSSNTAIESGLTKHDHDKNADTTVSSTVDETRTSYISDTEQAPIAYDSGRPRGRNQRSMSRGESVEKGSTARGRRDAPNRELRRQRSRSNQYYREVGGNATNLSRGQRYQDTRPMRNFNEDRRWPVHDNRRNFHNDNRPYKNQASRSRTPPIIRHRTGGTGSGYRGARHNNTMIGRRSSSSNSEAYWYPPGRQERDWRNQDDRRRRRSSSWQSGNNEMRSRDNLRRENMRLKPMRRERRQSHDSSFDSQDNAMMRVNRRSQREDTKRRGNNNRFYESPDDMKSKRKRDVRKGSTSRQRNHSSSFEEREVRLKKRSKNRERVFESSLHRGKKKRSYTPNISDREEREIDQVKSTVKHSDSECEIDSDSSVDFKKKNRPKKANKEKKSKKRLKSTDKRDSETSSINSATIPASYQAVKKQKQFEKASSSDSEVSSDTAKRKQKTKKSRKI